MVGSVRLNQIESLAGDQCHFRFQPGPLLSSFVRALFGLVLRFVGFNNQDNSFSVRFPFRAVRFGVGGICHAEEGIHKAARLQAVFTQRKGNIF